MIEIAKSSMMFLIDRDSHTKQVFRRGIWCGGKKERKRDENVHQYLDQVLNMNAKSKSAGTMALPSGSPSGFKTATNSTVATLVKASIKDSNLPFSVQFSIKEIDYKSQSIEISHVGCLPGLLPIIKLSASPFQFQRAMNFTIFNCSKIERNNLYYPILVPSLSSRDYAVYAYPSFYSLYEMPLHSCSKILKNDSSILHDTECYSSKPEGSVPKLRIAGEVLGLLLAVFLAIASYWIYSSIKLTKESELKIEQFLWYPVERPSMKVAIQMLESEETPSMPRNPFTSTNGTQNATNALGRIFNSELEIISESE
ncbi:unnamed protein product [Fraxinus pennsylvanica]|uniref:RING-type E3 ubiquitin transferase n=1 Tax=Fraxinus pennsylvanica TaxID=56036 RepID=A0AAD1ZE48_9LAMI|nr:unnamed protein product [Fraxinus pennsylvanica]